MGPKSKGALALTLSEGGIDREDGQDGVQPVPASLTPADPGLRAALLNLRDECIRLLGSPSDMIELSLAVWAGSQRRSAKLPVWLLLVGAPGCGKSTAIRLLEGRRHTLLLGQFTEAGLLSGTYREDVPDSSEGGALRRLGKTGVILVSDFSRYLHGSYAAKSTQAAREIFDGKYVRSINREQLWVGKVGFIAGCTSAIDKETIAVSELGDRFLYYRHRIPVADRRRLARLAASIPQDDRDRRLRVAADRVLAAAARIPAPPRLDDRQSEILAALGDVAATMRTAVPRDRRERTVSGRPEPEATTRITPQLERLCSSLMLIGQTSAEAMSLTRKVALSSVPPFRLDVFTHLWRSRAPLTAQDCSPVAGDFCGKTLDRCLEDLTCLELVEIAGKRGKSRTWRIRREVRTDCSEAFGDGVGEAS